MYMKVILQDNPLIFRVEQLLGEPCRIDLLKRMQDSSIERTLVDVQHQENHYASPQDIERIIFDDRELSRKLFQLIQPHLPQQIGQDQYIWQLFGLNERLRFYTLRTGQSLPKHDEPNYQRSHREQSFFTLVFYLNGNYDGGESLFYENEAVIEPNVTVQPQEAQAVVFSQDWIFEAKPILQGEKYVLRADVMYRRVD